MNRSRRDFFAVLTGAAAAWSFRSAPGRTYTVQNVMDAVIGQVPDAPLKNTVDTLKSGTAQMSVTGVVTTMFATAEVVKQAAAQNANMIIAHEPVLYNHSDDSGWVAGSKIIKQKQDLLNSHGIALWRCHDYWHRVVPDGILFGFLKQTDWLQHNFNAKPVFSLPPTELAGIIDHLKKTLGLSRVKVIGDLSQSCTKIAVIPGAAGGQRHIDVLEKYMPDVLIVGELNEWETAEFVRDARSFGKPVSLIVTGHAVSEEPGMAYMAEWLRKKLPAINITHIASQEPFQYI